MTDRPNIILLTIDALRADHVGYHGYDRDTTPFLDSYSEENVWYRTAISPSSHTREAMPAVLAGQYPDVFAANGFHCVKETIANRLSEAGYRAAGFHSNPYLSRAYGFDSGFETFYDDLAFGQNRLAALVQRAMEKFLLNKGEYHARASEINRRALAWLDSIDADSWFLWNHYMDVHGPYNPPEGYTFAERKISNEEAHRLYQKCINHPDEITNKEQKCLIDNYDGEIRYLDRKIHEFFNELTNRGLLSESIVLITADHGDAFGEHGYYTHPRYLHESLIHVPLILSSKRLPDGKDVQTPISTLDIVPTILHMVDEPYSNLPGTGLIDDDFRLTPHDGKIIYSMASGEAENKESRLFSARRSRWKVVMRRNLSSGDVISERAIDLLKSPNEEKEVSASKSPLRDLRNALLEFSNSRISATFDNTNSEERGPPSEIENRLEALGYK